MNLTKEKEEAVINILANVVHDLSPKDKDPEKSKKIIRNYIIKNKDCLERDYSDFDKQSYREFLIKYDRENLEKRVKNIRKF